MKFTFKPFEGSKKTSNGAPEDAQNPGQKRREQVRRAQRTHRERKEAYVASLEAEVVQLRANETKIQQETKALYAEINLLRRVLDENGIAQPSRTGTGHSPLANPAEHGSTSADRRVLTLTVGQEATKGRNRRKQIYIQKENEETLPGLSQLVTPPFSGSTTRSDGFAGLSGHSPAKYIGSLDPEVIGMDFVLTLESPCLPHIDVANGASLSRTSSPSNTGSSPATSTGHALTVSACLFHSHPSPPGQRQFSPASWDFPSASIDQLLSLSQSVPLQDSEVTPVQAWDYVRRHEQFPGLEVTRWEALKEKLVGFVKCYGFGAVIQQDVFENAVFEAIVVGRVF
ncbi:hypothetical protein BDW02DRAFT_564090 [Decorospora gaudefroyi]|uniref:BZIP domain-containing protein n=1 Tax=Decorospora gaudefroyi TaxID=184978 RepID=A0A6A5KVV8_9PLEO|nr:hypothetical protein BDW02DRAFT_564090 [Decorospora gaudefroyi]